MLLEITRVVSPFRRGSSPYRHQLRGRRGFLHRDSSGASTTPSHTALLMIGFGRSGIFAMRQVSATKFRPPDVPSLGDWPGSLKNHCESISSPKESGG
jgi:hypothetical protein